jgi:hypothetical protein
VLVIEVVVDRRRQRLGRQERGLDGVEPALEVADERADVSLSMFTERVAAQVELSGFSSSP